MADEVVVPEGHTPVVARSLESGVYYSTEDLAGLGRRMLVLLVDFGLLLIAWSFMTAIGSEVGVPRWVVNFAGFVLAWAYFAWLKAGSTGSVGYRLAGVRLVDLNGERLTLWRATCRFMFLFWGPINFLVDILWLTSDPNRQSLRDKLAGTYVVRRGALPLGRAPITYPTYFIATLSFIVPEVCRPTNDGVRAEARKPTAS